MELFKPHRIIPNTLEPGLSNLDWISIDNIFEDCLSSHGKHVGESISGDITKKVSEDNGFVQLDPLVELADDEKGDMVLKSLEGGDEAIGLAERWMAPDKRGLKKLQRMQEYLPESVKIYLEKIVSQPEIRNKLSRKATSRRKPGMDGVEPGDG